ncbi:LytR family transcriptional regulator [Streptomyces sp. RKND-216]|uniref:LCP family protein n=1 Tax=Streptomyces sp. RKND-216 TaxID=2562581 RepID=UPI00109DD6B1|nr:LCP family protein [Streptomyces sp. RKND-216]THA26478.1 LytR family transcriptional regulator [Streptomyces sp. RKND-216]
MSQPHDSDDHGWNPYDGQQPRILGYDEYGRPVYARDPAGQGGGRQQTGTQEYGYGQPYDAGAYGGAGQGAGTYGTGGYGTGAYGTGGYDTGAYDTGTFDAYDPYGTQTGSIPPVTDPYTGQPYGAPAAPESFDPYGPAADTGTGTVPAQSPPPAAERTAAARRGAGPDADAYDTDQFSFVEEEAEESEDVIDWLKFSESRTERREEAKRRGRNRKRALVILLVLALLGGVGYLWWAGKLPGLDGGPGAGGPAAGQQRDVLVVHLRDPDSEANATALLVDNATTEQGTTLLLPNSLAVTTSDGSTTTLGKSVESEGATPTRDALSQLLGADIKGTWRLDTPFLETLVDAVGGVTLDVDATVRGEKKGDDPLVEKGRERELDGRAAVAYATHREEAEPRTAQLERFGQVMEAVLDQMSTDKASATKTVESLGQILDPSLSQASLGASLASLAARAQADAYETRVLPAEPDGTLSAETGDGMVKDVLGGTVQNSDPDAAPRVLLRNAAGDEGADDAARVTLVNGGFSVVGASEADGAEKTSKVLYAEAAQKERAQAVAKTLGLPDNAVRKGDAAGNADVTVVLGQDYDG